MGCMAVALAGCGSDLGTLTDSNGQPVAINTLGSDAYGMVYLRSLAPDAPVRIKSADSGLLLYELVANGSGVFTIPAGTLLPKAFRIEADTPEGVTVERYVEGADDLPFLWINVPTTLISRYRRSHPETDLSGAEARVRSGLGIASNQGIYGTNESSTSQFSHRLFLQEANLGGGFQAYLDQVVQQIQQGQVVSFEAPARELFASGSGFRQARVLSKGLVSTIGGFLLHETASAVLDYVGTEAAGRISGYFGMHLGTFGALEEIKDQLSEISTQISELSDKIDEDANLSLITTNTVAISNTLTALNTTNQLMQDNANNAAVEYQSNPSLTDHGPGVVPSSLNGLTAALGSINSLNSAQVLTNALTSPSESSNLLILVAKQAMLELGQKHPSADEAYSDLRLDETMDKIERVLDVYSAWTLLCNLVFSETANLAYLPQEINTSDFNPPAPGLNRALDQIVELNSMLRRAQQNSPEPVGTDLVLIDSKAQLMWYLVFDLGKYDKAQNQLRGLTVNNWTYASGVSKPSKVGSSVKNDLQGFARDPRMTGWRVPEISELQQLYAYVEAAGGGHDDKPKTRSALKKLGFQGLDRKDITDHDNFKKIWYNGSVISVSGGSRFQYFNMAKGKVDFDLHSDAVIYNFQSDPKYSFIYVRKLPDIQFGDTLDQAYKSYGRLPSSVNLKSTSVGDSSADIFNLQLRGEQSGSEGFGDLGGRATWTLSGQSTTNPVAYLSYEDSQAQVLFNRPGTVTVTATFSTSQSDGKSMSATKTLAGTHAPLLKSIFVSPQNLSIQLNPILKTQKFYCTGYLANRRAVDLTNLVEWHLLDSADAEVSGPNLPFFNTNVPLGGLVFGTVLPYSTYKAMALYKAGSNAGADWRDGGQNFSSTAVFTVPTH